METLHQRWNVTGREITIVVVASYKLATQGGYLIYATRCDGLQSTRLHSCGRNLRQFFKLLALQEAVERWGAPGRVHFEYQVDGAPEDFRRLVA